MPSVDRIVRLLTIVAEPLHHFAIGIFDPFALRVGEDLFPLTGDAATEKLLGSLSLFYKRGGLFLGLDFGKRGPVDRFGDGGLCRLR